MSQCKLTVIIEDFDFKDRCPFIAIIRIRIFLWLSLIDYTCDTGRPVLFMKIVTADVARIMGQPMLT